MAKGSDFERSMAKRISLWWTDDLEENVFWRILGSGGRATRKVHTNKNTMHVSFGDIEATCSEAYALTDQILIELKRGYKQWAITDVLDARTVKNQVWAQFVEQVRESWAASGRRWWIVIFKRDQRQEMLMMDIGLFNWLYGKNPLCGDKRRAFRQIEHARLYAGKYSGILMRLEDFFKYVPPSVFVLSHRQFDISGPSTEGWQI